MNCYIQVELLTLKDLEYLPTKTSVRIQQLYRSFLSSKLSSCVNHNGFSHRICTERCICVSLEPEDVAFHKHDLESVLIASSLEANSVQPPLAMSLIYQPYLLPASLLFLLPAAKCSSRASFCVVATLTSCFKLFLPVPAIDLRGLCCAVSPAARSASL